MKKIIITIVATISLSSLADTECSWLGMKAKSGDAQYPVRCGVHQGNFTGDELVKEIIYTIRLENGKVEKVKSKVNGKSFGELVYHSPETNIPKPEGFQGNESEWQRFVQEYPQQISQNFMLNDDTPLYSKNSFGGSLFKTILPLKAGTVSSGPNSELEKKSLQEQADQKSPCEYTEKKLLVEDQRICIAAMRCTKNFKVNEELIEVDGVMNFDLGDVYCLAHTTNGRKHCPNKVSDCYNDSAIKNNNGTYSVIEDQSAESINVTRE